MTAVFRRQFVITLSVVLMLGLVCGWIVWRRTPSSAVIHVPQRPQEALRSELLLQEGQLYLRGQTNPFEGVLIEKYVDGVLKSQSLVLEGRLNGLSEGWFTNQVLAVQEYFTNGVSHGLRQKWYANGNKKSEAPIANGKIDGTFRRWDEEGWLSQEIEMKNGKAQGVSRAFFPSGHVKTEVLMNEGEVVSRQSWSDGEYRPTNTVEIATDTSVSF